MNCINQNEDDLCLKNVIIKVKEQLKLLNEKNNETIDQNDFKLLLNDSELLKRYLKRKHNNVDQSSQFIFEALQWRNKNQIHNFKDCDFPKEFYEFGGLYIHGNDINGNYILHIRTKLYQKINSISDLLKKFTIYMMYKIDKLASDAKVGWVIFFDCTDARLLNADIEMASFVVSTIRQYFPSGQSYALIHNCPWFLSALRNIIFTMLPNHVRKTVRFSNEKSLEEYIDKNNLPDYLNGIGDQSLNYRYIPENLKTVSEILNINEEDYKKVKKYYDKTKSIIEQHSNEITFTD